MADMSISKTNGPCQVNSKAFKVMGSEFNIDKRYQIIDPIGSGAYGLVVAAIDIKTGQRVAIKKIEKAFEHKIYTKRTLRELKIARLMDHPNLLKIETIQLPASNQDMNELYVITELMETDLSQIIKSPQNLTDDHIQFFLYQILRGLKYMHSAGVLHRDLKPRNILMNANCDIKICDFGLARVEVEDTRISGTSMTDYVATRWYRPPEVLLGTKEYNRAMDMWSIGCVLAEMLLRRPFFPGKDSMNQLQIIFNIIGSPDSRTVNELPSVRAKHRATEAGQHFAKDFDRIFLHANPLAIDLIKKLLKFKPGERLTVDEALEHPYLSTFYAPDDEPKSESHFSKFDFDFERCRGRIDYKELMYEEILLYHFPDRQKKYQKFMHNRLLSV